MQPFSVCVFCGARMGKNPAYKMAADALGALIANNGWQLIYGAGDIGLMGTVAKGAQAAGGKTVGVIPVHLQQREVAKSDLTHLIVTENMHERKKIMFMNSDAVVLLPGGAGSLDEIFEVLTWRQLGLHQKPILLLNTDGYWNPLLALVDHIIAEGFAEGSLRDMIEPLETPDQVIARLREASA